MPASVKVTQMPQLPAIQDVLRAVGKSMNENFGINPVFLNYGGMPQRVKPNVFFEMRLTFNTNDGVIRLKKGMIDNTFETPGALSGLKAMLKETLKSIEKMEAAGIISETPMPTPEAPKKLTTTKRSHHKKATTKPQETKEVNGPANDPAPMEIMVTTD